MPNKGVFYMASGLSPSTASLSDEVFFMALMKNIRECCRPDDQGPGIMHESPVTYGPPTSEDATEALDRMKEQIGYKKCHLVICPLDFAGPNAGIALMLASKYERPVLRIVSKAKVMQMPHALFALPGVSETVVFDPTQENWQDKLKEDITAALAELLPRPLPEANQQS